MTPTGVPAAGVLPPAVPPSAADLASVGSPASVLAMGVPGDQSVSPWVQLVPFALVLAIFYFVILMPMKRRQKKVQEFLGGLKVGDRVVTTGGIFGSITKITEQSIQLQIAQNVRVDVSRAAIVGYQGQAPVAEQHS
jgi:preprotein translocase subunit YajC